jgi:RNA polymerase-interacting CarD/CdnL/TRCF family regulator
MSRLFQVGEVVVHPSHGVGRIIQLAEKQFSEAPASLYYELVLARGTLWVQAESAEAARLRPVTPGSELARYRNVLRSEPGLLHKDHRQRNLELTARLKPGSFLGLCEVVRDLTARGRLKPLNDYDVAMLQRVQERLYHEWAAAAGVSVTEATAEIMTLLATAQLARLKQK